jgi:fumarylacetoacetase
MEIYANQPQLTSWIEVSKDSDFPIQNLPFGIFSDAISSTKRVGVALGNKVIDVYQLFELGYLADLPFSGGDFENDFLNDMMMHGKLATRALRNRIAELFEAGNETLKKNTHHVQEVLFEQTQVTMHLPVKIGDYTDFYSSEQHAYNVGCMFRDPNNALLPNWKHIPVGYHGRASSIVVSGTPIHRPKGQQLPALGEAPVFGPCKLLDFELEVAFVTFQGKPLGQHITTQEAEDFIFGMCLFNDWSARDIQSWEYVPLGPFLAKNFASSVSPWIVTLDALEPFRTAGSKQEPKVLPYLEFSGDKNIDINLEVELKIDEKTSKVISKSNYKYMYWNMNQQLAHHTINGCNINCGDMMASGTISGNDESAYGSMLEISWKGTKPIIFPNGAERKFVADGDTVIMRGFAQKNGVRVGFGEVSSTVLPAL